MKQVRALRTSVAATSGAAYAPMFSLSPAVLLFLSTCLYMSPALWSGAPMFLGRKDVAFVPYGAEARILAPLIVFGVLGLAVIRWRAVSLVKVRFSAPEAILAAGVFIALFVYTLATPELFIGNKNITLEATNRFHSAFYNLSILLVVTGAMKCGTPRWLVILGVFGLLLAMYIGHRSYLAITALSVAYVKLRGRSILSINPGWFIAAGALLVSLALYKSVYVAVKIGDVNYIANSLSPGRVSTSMQIGMEQFLIFRIFDMTLAHDFTNTCTNLIYAPLFLVPFSDALVNYQACTTNSQIQPQLFAHYTGGVASNIWAEFIATFGRLGIFLVPLVLLGLAAMVEFALRRVRSPLIAASLVVAIIQLTFYVQRNDFMTAFTFAKRPVFLAVALAFMAWCGSRLLWTRGGIARRGWQYRRAPHDAGLLD